MITAPEFLDCCHERGIRFISGTPCSYLKPLINAAIDDQRFLFRDAVNEGDAIAMAAGAVLGGVRTLVMLQNSGLGNAVNALTSLCYPFKIPILIVVTHRAEPGGEADEPQHEQMGRITTALLDTLEIPWARFPVDAASAATLLDRACGEVAKSGRPFALVMSKDAVPPHALKRRGAPAPMGVKSLSFREEINRTTDQRATRTAALEIIRRARSADEVLIATTGYTGRELYALGDDPWNLYIVGSMGSASAVGLGVALHTPKRVTVIDGDGALLMRMGNLATLGAYAPASLVHIVLDNEAHDSTGGQSTISSGIAFAAVAQACGYRRVVSTDEPETLKCALAEKRDVGPTFIHFRICTGAPDKLPRPKVTPVEVFRRLQDWVNRRPAA